jgi:hypothetical protein
MKTGDGEVGSTLSVGQESRRRRVAAKNSRVALLPAYVRWSASITSDRIRIAEEARSKHEKCEPEPPDPCRPIRPAVGPEQVIRYRQPFSLERLAVDVGDPVEGDALMLACQWVRGIHGDFALDLHYDQSWFYEKPVLGALSASIALAPGEVLSLSIRNTQRKQFEQQTLDEVERSQQTESTIADKDVLNVTRSSSKTNNWSVSGNGSIGISGASLGASGSASETISETSSSSAQRSRESTQKSASNLRTLQKVQVREMTEVTTEAATARRIPNPYRDRSVRLDVYELAKDYCVEYSLSEIVPSVVLTLDWLTFDRQFVLTNGSFLSDELIDRMLEAELVEALQVTDDLKLEGAEERARDLALLALEYLFAGPAMFNFPLFNSWDENDPQTSFRDPLEEYSGLQDSTNNKVGVVFSTLAFYNQLYQNQVLPDNGPLAVQLAVSLDEVLGPRWIGVEESEAIADTIDEEHATEILRRLAGFLTMTSGILRPLLQPAEEEKEARRSAERAEFVIARAVEHLTCFRRYYTERYLHYMGDRTQMRAIASFAEEVIRYCLPGIDEDLLSPLDPEASFLDRNRIVVPSRVTPSHDELEDLLERFGDKKPKIPFGRLDVHKVIVPTDGVHIEPTPGACILKGVSEEALSGPVHVTIDKD